MKRKFLYVLLILLVLGACFFIYVYFNDSYRFYLEYKIINYLPYENGKYIKVDIPRNNGIKYLEEEKIDEVFNMDGAIIYFGYSTCPWCRNIISPLIEVAKNSDTSLYYVDVHKLKNKDRIFELLGDNLKLDENKNKRLYVPDVYFVRDGEILFHHIGSIDSYKNPFIGMNESQEKELISVYMDGINMLKKEDVVHE